MNPRINYDSMGINSRNDIITPSDKLLSAENRVNVVKPYDMHNFSVRNDAVTDKIFSKRSSNEKQI